MGSAFRTAKFFALIQKAAGNTDVFKLPLLLHIWHLHFHDVLFCHPRGSLSDLVAVEAIAEAIVEAIGVTVNS